MKGLGAVFVLYQGLSLGQKIYFGLRVLVCPFRQVEALLPKQGRFIDVGCGYGFFANFVALLAPHREVLGYDINSDRIQVARRSIGNRNNIDFAVADAGTINFPECDVVTLIDLLHHIPNDAQKALVQYCFERLRTNGLLVIKDLGTKPRYKYLWNYIHDFLMTRGDRLYFRDVESTKRMLEQQGLTVDVIPIFSLLYAHVVYKCSKNVVDSTIQG